MGIMYIWNQNNIIYISQHTCNEDMGWLNMDKLQIGQIYYTEMDDGELDIVRIHSNHNGLVVSKGINKTRVSDDFLDEYTPLNPDGRLFLNIVNMGPTEDHGQDTVIVLIKEEDIFDGNYEPYAVCRQNIYDEYSNPFNRDNKEILGMSMNRDNVPRNATFSDMISSYNVVYSEQIFIYMNDNIDIIISMINDISKYNSVLFKIYKTLSGPQYGGLSKSLTSLLRDTNFNYDIKQAFNITIIDDILKIKDGILSDESRVLLESIFKIEMFQAYAMKYNYELDLSNIKRDYKLIEDKIGDLYVVGFDRGLYMNTYIDKDKTVLDAMYGSKDYLNKL